MVETRGKNRFTLFILLTLALVAAVFVFPDPRVEADQASDIQQCYGQFESRINSCISAASGCEPACQQTCQPNLPNACYFNCLEECDLTEAQCYGNAITGTALQDGFSDCLIENVFFTVEMCPGAPAAAALCDSAFQSCQAACDNIEDSQAAMELGAQCLDSYNECMEASGLWDCQ